MKQIRFGLAYSGSAVIIIVLLIDWRDVLTLLRRTDPTWFAIVCGWYVLTNLLRAYCFRALLDTDTIRHPLQILVLSLISLER